MFFLHGLTTTMAVLIRNGRLISEEVDEVCDILTEGEWIVGIGPSMRADGAAVIDASDCYVMPGGVDVHTHLDAPVGGTVSSDDFATGTRAAAFGGTTCIIDFATQQGGESLDGALRRWMEKARRSTIDFAFHMIVTDLPRERLSEIDRMVEEGVTSFKLFMAYPGVLMADDETILRVMERASSLGALTCIHAENGAVIQDLIRRSLGRGDVAPLYHALTRPPSAEGEATHRAIALADAADSPVYIVHVTCTDAASAIAAARTGGAPVFGETCPHYLLLTARELDRPGWDGAKFVLTPPLRDVSHHEPLWRALEQGDLQVVSTDHCPFFLRQKLASPTDFTAIPNGGPGIEHRVQLLYHYGVVGRGIPLRRWVELVSTVPAKLFGLYPRKGTLQVGSDADLVVWNPAVRGTISAATHHMNVDYSLFEGTSVSGDAEVVMSRGEIIVRKGQWMGREGRGRYVVRQPFAGAWTQGEKGRRT